MIDESQEQTQEQRERQLKRLSKRLKKREQSLKKRELRLCEEEKRHDFNIEYKSQAYAAFYSTSMERDKSVLTIAVAGLGFLIAIIQSENIEPSQIASWLLTVSCFCYLISIGLLLTIFKFNKEYLITLATDDENGADSWSKKLSWLDNTAYGLFYLAIIHSVALGIVTSNFIG